MTLGTMLAKRIDDLGVARSDVLKSLRKRGVLKSKQALSSWLNDVNRPSDPHLGAMLDVLMVHGSARLAFYEAPSTLEAGELSA